MKNLLRLSLENDEKEEYMTLINGHNQQINVIVVSCKNLKIAEHLSFTIKNSKKFIKRIPLLFKQYFKAVILNLFHIHQSSCYSSNLKLCEAVRAQFKAIKVPHFFLSGLFIELSTMLIVAGIDDTRNGDIVIVVKHSSFGFHIFELEFSSNGFEVSDRREISVADEAELLNVKEKAREEIIGSGRRPIKIILDNPTHSMMQLLKTRVLASDINVFEFFSDRDIQIPQFLSAWTKWLYDRRMNQYFIKPYCMGDYQICLSRKGEDDTILETKFKDSVPFEESVLVPKFFTKCFLRSEPSYCKEIQLEEKCHRNRITLMVDEESFPSWKVEPIFLPLFQNLPQKLNTVVEEKIPVIGFFDECSVICITKNGKSNYKFLDTWNDQFGIPVAISFEKEKPIYGKDALQTYTTKPTYFVFDLLKIMSMPPDAVAIKCCSLWKFKIIKDDEHLVLMEFDTAEDGRKAASPAFLMAMVLRQAIKAIREATGKKPKILGFCLIIDYAEAEKTRIQEQLKETCKLLKVKCAFVKLFD